MKIKNELVSIKIGKKQYDFNNLMLDEYLKRFVKAQLSTNNINQQETTLSLSYCLIKFDEPLEDIKNNSVFYNADFDICIEINTRRSVETLQKLQTINQNQVTVQYTYETDNYMYGVTWDYKKNTNTDIQISDYYGKKITAIGFNSYYLDSSTDSSFDFEIPVCSILDTSNYNIYLQENQNLTITRKDIITTDALFYSNNKDKVPGPAHLAPLGIPLSNEEGDTGHYFNDFGYGILYSVGLSSYSDYIDKEFIIGQDIEVEENGTELNIKGLENYLATDNSLFPSNNIYPSAGLYPIKTNYKYVILKYKTWQMVDSEDGTTEILVDTGYYYYQAFPIDKFGELDLKIKYERG